MSNSFVPRWIQQDESDREQRTLKADANNAKEELARLKIKADAQEFIRRMVKELQLAAAGLAEHPNLLCRVTYQPSELETHCRVSVQAFGAIARQTYVDVFHAAGSNIVRFLTVGGNVYNLSFSVCPDGDDIGLIGGNIAAVMNPEEAAEYIVKPMMQWVLGNANELY